MEAQQKIAMVILAAGASSRMKAIKQLLPWKNATLLGNAIEQGLSSSIDTVFVVLGANKEKIASTLKGYKVEIIENKDWQLGLGKSIACAIAFINNSPTKFDAILIALADQPLLTTRHYNKLIAEFSENCCGIAATKQNKTIGVPAVFIQSHFEELSILNQDKGAKNIIKKYQKSVYTVDAEEATVDIDTLETYNYLYSKHGS